MSVLRKLLQVFLTTVVFALVGCNGGKNQTNIELMQGMMDQVSIKAQDEDPNKPGQLAMRQPPENTIPRNFKPYRYKGEPEKAARQKNPFGPGLPTEVLSRGRKKYDIYCTVCHGVKGAGDGPVASAMAVKPPSLLTHKVKNLTDGRIYHIITDGQGVMGNYMTQIHSEKDRWAIVSYIRSLQKRVQ